MISGSLFIRGKDGDGVSEGPLVFDQHLEGILKE